MATATTMPSPAQRTEALPYGFLAAIFTVNLLAFLNFVGVYVAMVAMRKALDAPPIMTLQLPTALYVAVACAAPATPYLMRRLGSRRLLLLAIAGMSATTVVAALSDSFWPLLVVLFIHGAFCAPISPVTQAAVSVRMEGRDLGLGMAVWGAGNYASYLIGPILAGWLVDTMGWQSVLLLPLPFALLALPLVLRTIPRDAGFNEQGDVASIVLAPLAIFLLLATVSLGPSLNWFASPIVAGGAIGFAIAAPLYLWSYRRTPEPRFHLGCLRDGNASLALLLALLFNLVCTGLFQVEFLGQEAHLSAGILGIRTAVSGGALLLGFVISGWLGHRNRFGIMLLGGMAISLAGKVGYLLYGSHVGAFEAIWPAAVSSIGFGMVTGALATLAYRTVDPKFAAHVATAFILAIYLGASLGAGVLDEVYVLALHAIAGPSTGSEADQIRAFMFEFQAEIGISVLLFIPGIMLLRRSRVG